MNSNDTLARLAAVLESRKPAAGGDPEKSGEYYYTSDHYRSFQRIRE